MDLTAMKNRAIDYLPSSLRHGAERASAAASSFDYQQWLTPVEKLVKQRPAVSLATAFAIGVAIAWFVKRR